MRPMPDLSSALREQLPRLTRLEGVLHPSDRPTLQVLLYDTTTDISDPHPMVAIVESGRVQATAELDELTSGQGGFTRLLSGCTFRVGSGREMLALAVSNGYDGAASDFAIVEIADSGFKTALTVHAQQARMEIGKKEILITSAHNDHECVWCLHWYVIQRYRLERDHYLVSGSPIPSGRHDPATWSSRALILKPGLR